LKYKLKADRIRKILATIQFKIFWSLMQKCKSKVSRTVILYSYVTWFLLVKEERILRVSRDQGLRRISEGEKKKKVTGDKLHNDNLQNV
jgi:hypothetical protein